MASVSFNFIQLNTGPTCCVVCIISLIVCVCVQVAMVKYSENCLWVQIFAILIFIICPSGWYMTTPLTVYTYVIIIMAHLLARLSSCVKETMVDQESFSVEAVGRGCHGYKDICTAIQGKTSFTVAK